jgi:hypothetical protein
MACLHFGHVLVGFHEVFEKEAWKIFEPKNDIRELLRILNKKKKN